MVRSKRKADEPAPAAAAPDTRNADVDEHEQLATEAGGQPAQDGGGTHAKPTPAPGLFSAFSGFGGAARGMKQVRRMPH